MKKSKIPRQLLLAGIAGLGLAGLALPAYGLHNSGNPVILRDHNNQLAATTGLPYSPKNTCGLASCHDNIALSHGIGNIYESDWQLASKTHYNRDGAAQTYDVPYPAHGVSAGYHFQQGRNVSWDATKQEFYHLPEFTSSPGMFGKY